MAKTAPAQPKDDPQPPTHISDDGRNGLITAQGIVLGFAVGFFGQWSLDDEPWERGDFWPLLALGGGLTLLCYSLFRALIPYVQTVGHYEKTVWVFVGGLALVFIGILLGLRS
jgi:hypothetical protein